MRKDLYVIKVCLKNRLHKFNVAKCFTRSYICNNTMSVGLYWLLAWCVAPFLSLNCFENSPNYMNHAFVAL